MVPIRWTSHDRIIPREPHAIYCLQTIVNYKLRIEIPLVNYI